MDIYQIYRITAMWLGLITWSFTMTACSGRFMTTLTPEPTATLTLAPTQFTAQLFGELAIVQGCLRVIDRYGDTTYLIAWPPDFSVSIEQDNVKITKGNGEEVTLRIGQEIFLSGGEVYSRSSLDERVQKTLPTQCPGPYWIVGSHVSPVEATKEPK